MDKTIRLLDKTTHLESKIDLFLQCIIIKQYL